MYIVCKCSPPYLCYWNYMVVALLTKLDGLMFFCLFCCDSFLSVFILLLHSFSRFVINVLKLSQIALNAFLLSKYNSVMQRCSAFMINEWHKKKASASMLQILVFFGVCRNVFIAFLTDKRIWNFISLIFYYFLCKSFQNSRLRNNYGALTFTKKT